MTEQQDHTPGPVDSLIADFRVARKRLVESPPDTVEGMVAELRNNVYPSMIALAEQIIEIDEVVLEMSEQQDSFIQQELASQIYQTIAIGSQVLEETRNMIPEMSDIAKNRVTDLLDGFEHSMELTMMGVSNATVDPDDEDGDENEDEDDPSKEDEIEESQDVEIPLPIAAETKVQDPPVAG